MVMKPGDAALYGAAAGLIGGLLVGKAQGAAGGACPFDFSNSGIGTPKYQFTLDLSSWNSCKFWNYIPPVEQSGTFWDIVLNDKDTLRVTVTIGLPANCNPDAIYLRFQNATFDNVPANSFGVGALWKYFDKNASNNPGIPQFIAAPGRDASNPDASWGSDTVLLYDASFATIQRGTHVYDLVYRGPNSFHPKSFEVEVVNEAGNRNVC